MSIVQGESHVRQLRLWLCAVIAAFAIVVHAAPSEDSGLGRFRRLMFNNPGLEVDLGLGIWPFAEVFDYDGDGRMDVFVRAGCVLFKDARVYINRSPGKSPTVFAAGFSVPDNTGKNRTATGGHPATDGLKSPHPNKPHTMRGRALRGVVYARAEGEDAVHPHGDGRGVPARS